MKYILDGQQPAIEPDLLKWAKWLETADRTVANTTLSHCRISTIFLGIDYNFAEVGPPLLFETLIVGGENDEENHRYSTWEQAETEHQHIVERERAKESLKEGKDES